MVLKDFVAVSGLPGLFKMVNSRNNGIVVKDIDTGKTKFVSVRKHQFTPLDTVAIYTDIDSCEMQEVFENIRSSDIAIPSVRSTSEELFAYFAEIVPNYDREQVKVSDVKKVIKWYNFLNERNLLDSDEEE